MRVFLGKFHYVDVDGGELIRITYEDGTGHVLSSILLGKAQWLKLKAVVDGEKEPHSCVLTGSRKP